MALIFIKLFSLIKQFHFLQASALVVDICRNLQTAAKSADNMEFTVVLRGDSTLRGHFPEARHLKHIVSYIV